MSTINTSYAAMQYTMNATQQSNKQTKQQGSSKVAQSSQTEAAGQKTLSKDAQAVLDKLKSKYGNMDFFVADPDSEDEAKEIMSRGTKEYSVMISSDELEKMAADEDYYNKNINTIDDAVKKSGLDTEAISDIPENIRHQANKRLPGYSQITKVEQVMVPFEKTPKMSIKRFLYK